MLSITADQARNRARDLQKEAIQQELQTISNTIVKAINLGKNFCAYVPSVKVWDFRRDLVNELHCAGFVVHSTVSSSNSNNGAAPWTLSISW